MVEKGGKAQMRSRALFTPVFCRGIILFYDFFFCFMKISLIWKKSQEEFQGL